MFSEHMMRMLLLIGISTCLSGSEPVRISMSVDFGDDRGQNLGSLFELMDRDGRVVAGAGFMGAYNTQPRSSRRNLQLFVKPAEADLAFELSALPKPTTDAGVYVFDHDERLYGRSRNGTDKVLRVWNAQKQVWEVAADAPVYPTEIGNLTLTFDAETVRVNGKVVASPTREGSRFGEHYLADGVLLLREFDKASKPFVNRIVAATWWPKSEHGLQLDAGVSLPLRSAKEFVYGFGQLGTKIIVATNTGGVYEFDGEVWRCLIEPDHGTSFQIYTILNYRDRLWMGHYPTGNIFEYDGSTVRRIRGAPPVWHGAVDRAREAQTLAIYGGDIYCGVWPWGEVWRFDTNEEKWFPVARMFSHPEVSGAFRHPYEEEMSKLQRTPLNVWGQRVTSMVPFGDSLFIGTSAKTSAPYDPRYDFLSAGRWRDYGKIHRLTVPGHLSAHFRWTGKPIRFEFVLGERGLAIVQDGKEIGRSRFDAALKIPAFHSVRWGRGVFGDLHGEIVLKASSLQFEK